MDTESDKLEREFEVDNKYPYIKFLYDGEGYLNSANLLLESNFISPAYNCFLICVELTLKSYLNFQGVTLKELKELKDTKKYGHDLSRLIKKSFEESIPWNPGEETIKSIEFLSKNYYTKHYFRYDMPHGFHTLPNISDIGVKVLELQNELKYLFAKRLAHPHGSKKTHIPVTAFFLPNSRIR